MHVFLSQVNEQSHADARKVHHNLWLKETDQFKKYSILNTKIIRCVSGVFLTYLIFTKPYISTSTIQLYKSQRFIDKNILVTQKSKNAVGYETNRFSKVHIDLDISFISAVSHKSLDLLINICQYICHSSIYALDE